MAAGDIIMSLLSGGVPALPCSDCNCGIYYGDTMDFVLSGLAACDCYAVVIDGPTRYFKATISSGVNGAFTASASGLSPSDGTWQSGVIGVLSIQEYGDGCIGEIGDPFDSDVSAAFQCYNTLDPDLQNRFYGSSMVLLGSSFLGTPTFTSSVEYPELGETVPNLVECDPMNPFAGLIAGGNWTILGP